MQLKKDTLGYCCLLQNDDELSPSTLLLLNRKSRKTPPTTKHLQTRFKPCQDPKAWHFPAANSKHIAQGYIDLIKRLCSSWHIISVFNPCQVLGFSPMRSIFQKQHFMTLHIFTSSSFHAVIMPALMGQRLRYYFLVPTLSCSIGSGRPQ